MNKHFCNYENALDLKELGIENWIQENNDTIFEFYNTETKEFCDVMKEIPAPLKTQAFDFFRKKFKLKGDVTHATSNGTYTYTIWKWNYDNNIGKWERIGCLNSWFEYEEAEQICIDKLIELTKNK